MLFFAFYPAQFQALFQYFDILIKIRVHVVSQATTQRAVFSGSPRPSAVFISNDVVVIEHKLCSVRKT